MSSNGRVCGVLGYCVSGLPLKVAEGEGEKKRCKKLRRKSAEGRAGKQLWYERCEDESGLSTL